MVSPLPMPHFVGWNATLHGGKCHTWDVLRCGIRGAEVWHPERWGVASGTLGCGIPDAGVWRFSRVSVSAFSMKAAGFATSTNGQFRSRRRYCPVGVALRRGWGSPGRCAVRPQAARSGRGREVRRRTAPFRGPATAYAVPARCAGRLGCRT